MKSTCQFPLVECVFCGARVHTRMPIDVLEHLRNEIQPYNDGDETEDERGPKKSLWSKRGAWPPVDEHTSFYKGF
jgi:hypothetical protein